MSRLLTDFTEEELRTCINSAYDKKFDKNKNLKLGIITIDLTNVIAPNGKQVYKGYFEKVREVLRDNELCNI